MEDAQFPILNKSKNVDEFLIPVFTFNGTLIKKLPNQLLDKIFLNIQRRNCVNSSTWKCNTEFCCESE